MIWTITYTGRQSGEVTASHVTVGVFRRLLCDALETWIGKQQKAARRK